MKSVIKEEGSCEETDSEFYYDSYIRNNNCDLLDEAHQRFLFSVIDSDYYIVHPFNKLINIASKDYDRTLEIGDKNWYTDKDSTQID